MSTILRQCLFIPSPPLTEKNLPDQSGKVHIVTGGYSGCGLHLSKVLYQKNAIVYMAGRSTEKAAKAINTIKQEFPAARGRLEFLQLDLGDQKTIYAAVKTFTSKEDRLDVLTNNAGVATSGSVQNDAYGREIHFSTNCLGPFLLSELLIPILRKTAAGSPPGSVRVTWASSLTATVAAPTGGINFDLNGSPISSPNSFTNYSMSKAGNWFLAVDFARRYGKYGIVSVAWNPGNLASELMRESTWFQRAMVYFLLYPPVFGAYTELYAGWSPDLTLENNGSFVYPWGRIGTDTLRSGLLAASRPIEEGGTGESKRFWEWCDKESNRFR